MSGRSNLKRTFIRWIKRRDVTILLISTGCLLPALIGFAMYDFISTVKTKEDQVQVAALKSEVAQFALGLREDEGSALVDNPQKLSETQRSLSAIVLRKPFFTYFLNRGNARTFETKKLSWDAPKSCSVDFPEQNSIDDNGSSKTKKLRACLALVQNEPTGRFVYLSIRYPIQHGVIRHIQGKQFQAFDHVTIDLKSERNTRVSLVFQPPTLAMERYPSQKQRFIGLHEVTAYFSDDPQKPLRSFNGQAYEHSVEDEHGSLTNYVTILGRFDATTLGASQETISQWFSGQYLPSASISVYSPSDIQGASSLKFRVAENTKGESLLSFEKLYKTHVLSKASLEIFESGASRAINTKAVWRSDELFNKSEIRPSGNLQRISDWWANQMVGLFDYKKEPALATQYISAGRDLKIIIRQDRTALPDIATRAFLFLSLALVIVLVVSFLWGKAIIQMHRIAQTAYKITVAPTSGMSLDAYAHRRDEIGTLGRIFHLLIRRGRSRNAGLIRRAKQDDFDRSEKIRIAQDQVLLRQAALDAIGHEIKSPLQALLNSTPEASESRNHIERMSRAVEALDFATSIEAGFKSGRIVLKTVDIAEYLFKFAQNTSAAGKSVHFDGPTKGIFAIFDPISLEQVFDHLMDNAIRLRVPETEIEISLRCLDETVEIEVFNQGPQIISEPPDIIFNYGVSSKLSDKNRGQGLFVARIYLVGMNGSINVENRESGVSFILSLPRK